MSWTPIDKDILTSTLWEMRPAYVKVWITLQMLKDDDGDVWCTEAALARTAKVKPSIVREALKIFMEPDPESRSTDHEGRRLLPLTRGWHVVNHDLYRERMKGKSKGRVGTELVSSNDRVGAELLPSYSQIQTQQGRNSAPSGVETSENHSGSSPTTDKKEETRQQHQAVAGAVPAWDQEECWIATASLWKQAPLAKGKDDVGEDAVFPAKKPFCKKINASNWHAFYQRLQWAVERRFKGERLPFLYQFIDEGDWKLIEEPLPEFVPAPVPYMDENQDKDFYTTTSSVYEKVQKIIAERKAKEEAEKAELTETEKNQEN